MKVQAYSNPVLANRAASLSKTVDVQPVEVNASFITKKQGSPGSKQRNAFLTHVHEKIALRRRLNNNKTPLEDQINSIQTLEQEKLADKNYK